MPKCVVAYGNPFDGVHLAGPFDSLNEAGDWADLSLGSEDWWAVGLESPAPPKADT